MAGGRTAKALDSPKATWRGVSPDESKAVPLAEWGYSGARSDREANDYGYPAALSSVTSLSDGLSQREATEVIKQATTGHTANDLPDQARLTRGARPGWRQFYDLLDAAGERSPERVLRMWVIPSRDLDELAQREASGDRYATLDAADGSWAPPARVRAALARWDFDVAEAAMADEPSLAATAQRLQDHASGAGLTIAGVRTAYQNAASAADYDRLAPKLAATSAAITAYTQARDESGADGLLYRIGARLYPARAIWRPPRRRSTPATPPRPRW